MPAPPSTAPAPGGFNENDDTPRRKIQRAYSLPHEIDLPDDPKRWTPTEVSLYLAASLNATGGGYDLPTSVARDISTFVKDKKITGKIFLRLNEVNLAESVLFDAFLFLLLDKNYRYGINQLWRTTLIDASRSLRRKVSHGRVWDNHAQHEEYDDGDGNILSFNSNFGPTNRKRSLSTTSESRGRVRDMVDTLERSSSASGSDLDEEGSCTGVKGNKDTRSKRDKVHHHRHRSLEQQPQQEQQQGRLPQRGSVNNLFGTGELGPENQSEDKDSTITAHTRRNVNGHEPRLLPFPPSEFLLGFCK